VQLDYKELKVTLVRKAQSVCKDLLDLKVRQVLQDRKVQQDHKVPSVHKEQQVQLVHKVLQEVSEQRALLVRPAPLVQRVQLVQQERLVRKVLQEQMELQHWVITVPFMTHRLKLQLAWIQRAPSNSIPPIFPVV
jgi:hypothetical protein